MTIDERLEALTARHEALTMNVELMQTAQAESQARHDREMAEIRVEGQKFRDDLRRWATLGVKEARKHREEARKHRERIQELETKSAEYQARTDQNLSEITDKLNGLISYVEGGRNGGSKR